MKNSSALTATAALLVILLIVPPSTRLTTAQSISFSFNTSMFVPLGPPLLGISCGLLLPCVTVTYHSAINFTLSMYMWVNVLNSQGQTIGVFIGSAKMAGGQNTTINAALLNVGRGNYSAMVFLTSPSGGVGSITSTLNFTLP